MSRTPSLVFIIASAALLPVYLVKIDLWGIKTNWLDMLMVAAVVFGLTYILQNRVRPKIDSFWVASLLLIIAATVSVLVAPNTMDALGAWKSWFILPVLVAFIGYSIRLSEDEKRIVAYSLIFSGAVASAYAIYQFFTANAWVDYQGVERAAGFFSQPNYLALFLIVPLVLSIALIKDARRAGRWLIALGVVVQLIAFVLTYSRAGYVALAASVVILAWRAYRWKGVAATFVVGLIMAASLYSLVPAVKTRFSSITDTASQTTSRVRLEINQATLSIIKSTPIIGVGLTGYQDSYIQHKPAGALEDEVLHPHNIFLAFWAQSGFLGLAAFVFLSVWAVSRGLRGSPISSAAAISIIASLIFGLFDTPYWKNDLALIYWLALLISYSSTEVNLKINEKNRN